MASGDWNGRQGRYGEVCIGVEGRETLRKNNDFSLGNMAPEKIKGCRKGVLVYIIW